MTSNYGENLRKVRQAKGISQEAMAVNLNISQATYSRIEGKVTSNDKAQAIEIAKLLEVLPADLMPFPRHTFFGPSLQQHAKEFVNSPLGMIVVLGSSAAFVDAVYQICEGFCDGLGTTENTKIIVKWTAALATICYIYYLVRKVKQSG